MTDNYPRLLNAFQPSGRAPRLQTTKTPSFAFLPPLTMLKRQRPSSPLPIPATYGDDLSSGPTAFHPTANMSVHADPPFGNSRKRPRIYPDITPGVSGMGGSGSTGRHTFASSSVLSKRRRSPDPMDDSDDSEDDSESRPGPQFSNTSSDYQQEREPFDYSLPSSHATINLKRRRTIPPLLEGSSRGWGLDQPSHTGTGPEILSPASYPYPSFDPTNPPPGWILETQIGEYAQENARLHNLHTLRPRLPHPEETTQDQLEIASVGVDMEEKVVKERYEERNRCVLPRSGPRTLGYLTTYLRLLGSLFLERQRRLTGV